MKIEGSRQKRLTSVGVEGWPGSDVEGGGWVEPAERGGTRIEQRVPEAQERDTADSVGLPGGLVLHHQQNVNEGSPPSEKAEEGREQIAAGMNSASI